MSTKDSGAPEVDPEGSFEARVDAATAMRRLSHAMVGHSIDPEVLKVVATEANRLAERLEATPPRDRMDASTGQSAFARPKGEEPFAGAVSGDGVDLFHDSPVSGSTNPMSIGLKYHREGDEVVGEVTLGPAFEGAPGRSHGGMLASCIDETMGALLPTLGVMAFTGKLNVTFRAPAPIGVPIEFRSSLRERSGRKLTIDCVGTSEEGVFITADALFIAIDPTAFAL